MASVCPLLFTPAQQQYCALLLGNSYDPVQYCVNRRVGSAIDPVTGRPNWGCPRLYSNQAPINLNNYDGYGLTAAMPWCASAVGFFGMIIFLAQVLRSDMGKPRPIVVSQLISSSYVQYVLPTGFTSTTYLVVMFAAMCGYLFNSTAVECPNGGSATWYPTYTSCNPYVGTPSLQTLGVFTGLCFLTGGLLSGLAVVLGIWISLRTNVRACWACKESVNYGMFITVRSGAASGLAVTCCGLMGLLICWLIFTIDTLDQRLIWQYLAGFGFGASTVALFARLVGGFLSSSAKVGVDVICKIDSDIPNDSERNSGVICDSLGDVLVGASGLGADLFESYVGALIAACYLGYETYSKLSLNADELCCIYGSYVVPVYQLPTNYALAAVAYPFWLAGVGIMSSVLGLLVVYSSVPKEMDNSSLVTRHLIWATRLGNITAIICYIGLSCLVSWMLLGNSGEEYRCFGCCVIGVVCQLLMYFWASFQFEYQYDGPIKGVARKTYLGSFAVATSASAMGLMSVIFPSLIVAVVLIATSAIQSSYGIAIAAVSMLAVASIQLAVGCAAPIASNARSIAEMCRLDINPSMQVVIDQLDGLGMHAKYVEALYASTTATTTTVALILTYMTSVGLSFQISVFDPVVLAGFFLGVMVVLIFAGMTLISVNRTAQNVIRLIKAQFDAQPELKQTEFLNSKELENCQNCVSIATKASILEFVFPFALPLFSPFVVGYLLGSRCLAGLLIGIVITSFGLGIYLVSTSGIADGARRYVQQGELVAGSFVQTSAPGNTPAPTTPSGAVFSFSQVNSPQILLRDTITSASSLTQPLITVTGPSLNVFMKSTALLSLVLAPSFRAVNQSGNVFPVKNFWIGIAIWGAVSLVLCLYYSCFLANRLRGAEKLFEKFNVAKGAKRNTDSSMYRPKSPIANNNVLGGSSASNSPTIPVNLNKDSAMTREALKIAEEEEELVKS